MLDIFYAVFIAFQKEEYTTKVIELENYYKKVKSFNQLKIMISELVVLQNTLHI